MWRVNLYGMYISKTELHTYKKNGILLGSREKLKVKRSLRQRERVSKYAGLNIHFNQIYNIVELRPSVADNKSIKYLAKNKNELPPRTHHSISRSQKNVPRPHVSHTW